MMKTKLLKQTKKGVTSLYVVIFATILFGVVTLGFIRLMVSESSQSVDEELSQSAYDAAMAGVEDAKVAVSKYYAQDEANQNPDKLFGGDCDDYLMGKFLYNSDSINSETTIQESSSNSTGTPTEQAYTCVIVSNEVASYLGTLDPTNRVKVIPLKNTSNEGIGSVEFSWYSTKNGVYYTGLDHGGYLKQIDHATIPPSISLTLITAQVNNDGRIEVASLDETNASSTVLALPSKNRTYSDEGKEDVVPMDDVVKFANPNEVNSPVQVLCGVSAVEDGFACRIVLNTKKTSDDNGCLNGADKCEMYLVASMPYGNVTTDFMVQIFSEPDAFGNPLTMEDVQVSVDSTGRANDLYRRVETRLSPSDDNFPYPQFELDISGTDGDENDSINKNFWVTTNCWMTLGNGIGRTCGNNSI